MHSPRVHLKNRKTIFIAGGGTGGHIYPGIAIARAIMALDPSFEIHFVGSAGGLETKIAPREGFALHLIAGGKLNFAGGVLTKIKTLLKMPIGIVQSIRLLIRYRPKFVLGVGGYASGPFVLAAACLGRPTAIWEPNAQPGLANRWLARFVDACYVVFGDADQWLHNRNIFQYGMPVRQEIEQAKQMTREDDQFHLLSFGGSQGSRAISNALADALLEGSWAHDMKVVHQIGALDFARFKSRYEGATFVMPMEFIYDMPQYYQWADLVVARGGASTIMELSAFGVPAIIIPLPLADDHQLKNAEILVRADAGRLILQKDLTPARLREEIQTLRADPERLKLMSRNMKTLFKPHAAQKIAQDILQRCP